jgi:hypothetical protein
MSNIVLTEPELKLKMAQIYKEEKLNQIKTIWETFDKNEKLLVFEFYKQIHPESKLLSEGKWYNWVGDILGFIPGLELVNIVNGVSYWKQGEKLYSVMSLLAGIPGMGLILGPLKTLVKGGGATARLLKGAIAAGDVGKIAKLGKESSLLGKFISNVGIWGSKLMGVLAAIGRRVPFLKTMIKGVEGFVDLFKGAKTKMVKPKVRIKPSKTKIDTSDVTSPLTDVGSGVSPSLGKMGNSDPITNALSSIFGK